MALNLDPVQTKGRNLPEMKHCLVQAWRGQGVGEAGSTSHDCRARICGPFLSLPPALLHRARSLRWKPRDQGLALPPQAERLWARLILITLMRLDPELAKKIREKAVLWLEDTGWSSWPWGWRWAWAVAAGGYQTTGQRARETLHG